MGSAVGREAFNKGKRMVARAKLEKKSLFLEEESAHEFFSSGCVLVDCVLGGGWPLGRICNIVGDKSTGKTQLAIEACANFLFTFPDGKIDYVETEAAFDQAYAEVLGLPQESIAFPNDEARTDDKEGPPVRTVEDFADYVDVILKNGGTEPRLIILDSLDATPDEATVNRDLREGSFNMTKQKQLSIWFGQIAPALKARRVTLMIISQVRDNIGVTFGEKHKRAGGRALDFYCSQVLWLTYLSRIKKTVKAVERVIGVNVKVLCKKNKIAPPFRDAEFPLLFNYGIEDVEAGLEFLIKVKRTEALFDSPTQAKKFVTSLGNLDADAYSAARKRMKNAVRSAWAEIEAEFAPSRRKYV